MVKASGRKAVLEWLKPYADRANIMSGWSFDVQARILGTAVPWDYMSRAGELIRNARSIIDLGTGGGERYGELCETYRGCAVAAEGWSRNVLIAAQHLVPKGVHVVLASSLRLPFLDGSFDLVLDRHEELSPTEVASVLTPGGHVLTQQVASSNWRELRRYLPQMPDYGSHFELYQQGFRRCGLKITRAELHETPVAYRNLGELVYLLQICQFETKYFDLERDIDALIAFEKSAKSDARIMLTEGRYIIEARKDHI